MRKALAAGGVLGPIGFIAAWSVLGATTSRPYSPVQDAISRLAEVDAPTQAGMTAGFVAFGIGVPMFGLALRHEGSRAWATAVATGLATLGVGATPLETSKTIDLLHGAFATVGYATLAATPWLGADHMAPRASKAAAIASGTALAATVLGPAHGLLQRVGLTIGDAWIVAMAVKLMRTNGAGGWRRTPPSRP
jgi:Protein of unknown function (DUF998)